jgi:serine protease Do
VGTLAARAERQCYQEQLTATLLQASLVVNPESFGGPLVDIRGRVVGMLVPPPLASTQGTTYALPIDLALNLYEALKVTESRRSPWLGVSVLELATARRRASSDSPRIDLPSTGVYIDDVFEPSPASRAGIRVGDSLVAIDGQRLLSVLDFQKWLYLAGIGHEVSLELHRAGETLVKRVQVEERPASATTR